VLILPVSDQYVMDCLIFHCLTLFIPKLGMSTLGLKYTKHAGHNSDVLQ